jgi:hypothetical protein
MSTSTPLNCPGTVLAPEITCPVIANTGVAGNSLTYDGTQYNYTSPKLTLASGLTIAYWAKPNTGTLMNAVAIGTSTDYVITGFDTSGRFFCSNKVSTLTAPQAVVNANWNHYACSLNSVTKQRTIYVNSLRVATDLTTVGLPETAAAFVGSNVLKNGAFYNGEIDELSIYNTELTYDDVEFLYLKYINDLTRISPTRTRTSTLTRTLTPTITNTPFPTEIARGNIARFSFNEATGTKSFFNQLSTDSGGKAECPTPLVCPIAGTSGVRFSNGITFTGSQTLKLVSTIPLNESKPFSVAAWVNSNYSSNSVILSARAVSPSTNKFILGLNGDGAPFCQYGNKTIASTDQIISERWIYLICSIDTNRNAVLYLNGAPVASGQMDVMPSGLINVWFGADGTINNNYFDGSIDEVSIFNQFATWNIAEVMYDQYAAAGQRSPTRSRTPTSTSTPSKTKTETKSPSPVPNGAYPYPAPRFTPSKTWTSTPRTLTATASTTRSTTPRPVYYPYP